MMIGTEDSIIRLCIALLLGAVIGYERQAQSKAAGLRTHTLVCVGACLCMIISINISMDYFTLYGYRNSDPERIAAQVVSGVGFLGAGTILANQKINNIQGLTTAAGLWVVAAIGLAVGAGYIVVSIAATAMIFVILTAFIHLDTRLSRRYRQSGVLHVTAKNTVGQSRRLAMFMQERHFRIESFRTVSDEDAEMAELLITVSSPHFIEEDDIIASLLALKGVTAATFTHDAADSSSPRQS